MDNTIVVKDTPVKQMSPVAFVNFADNGNIRIWTSAADEAVRLARDSGFVLTPLYSLQPDQLRMLEGGS